MKKILTMILVLLLFGVQAGAQTRTPQREPLINKKELARRLDALQQKADSLQARLDSLQVLDRLDRFGESLDTMEFFRNMQKYAERFEKKMKEFVDSTVHTLPIYPKKETL